MKVRHATPRRNLPSIRREGIDPKYARGRRKAVYVHCPFKTGWAVVHTADRHAVLVEDVVVLEMDLPRTSLVRMGDGLYYCWETITPDRVNAAYGCSEVNLFPEVDVDADQTPPSKAAGGA